MTQQLPEPIQFGKYTLYERIGRGGMADVFKGRISGPGGFERVFVVKRILPHLSDDPAFIKMFVEEAKMSARLNHPNIVQIFELGSAEDEFFISMEYVSGHDLSETMRALWKTSGAPRPDLVAFVGREMCRALGYAHGLTDEQGHLLGMIHRDVSPSNVMLSYEGAVKLLDFGIAKALGDAPDVSRSGTLKGKYAYMAPEQTDGDDVDHRIDIFAAGIVLHEVLTGRRLFKGANDIQTIERVRRCDVRPPSLLNPTCPPALDRVVLRALSRDPDDRFQSAEEMADALDEIVHAAHFTPQRMATILRETFGADGGQGASAGGAAGVDQRLGSTGTNASLTISTSSARRSPTVPPIAVSSRRTAGRTTATGGDVPDPALLGAIRPRPMWRRGAFWAVFALCAAGVGVAVTKGVGSNPATPVGQVGPGGSRDPGGPHERTAGTNKVKPVPVLIQTEPEGADVFVAGKLESLGSTPMWVNLEMDQQNPARVMLRKRGFQDKAIAVETVRPAMVQLIPIDPPGPAVGGTKQRPESAGPVPAPARTATAGSETRTGYRRYVRRPFPGRRAAFEPAAASAAAGVPEPKNEPEAIDKPEPDPGPDPEP